MITPKVGMIKSVIEKIIFVLEIDTTLPRVECGGVRIEAMIKDVRAVWEAPEPPKGCHCPFPCHLHEDEPFDEAKALSELQEAKAFIGHKITIHEYYTDSNDSDSDSDSDMAVVTDTFSKTFENDKGFFTAAELVSCIVEWEKIHREHKWWRGAIDAHHVYFEGLDDSLDLEGNIIENCYTPQYGS